MTQATALEKLEQPAAPIALVEKPNSLAKIDLRELKQIAEIMVASGAFSDIQQVAQAQVKIMAGAELGFSPIVSMTGIHFFNGKVEFSSTLKASLVKESKKYDYEVVEHTNEVCAVQFYRIGNIVRTPLGPPVRYTTADAKAAELASKGNWKKHPSDMLFAACIRQGVRRHCADVLRGVSSDTDVDLDETAEVDALVEQGVAGQFAANPSETIEHYGDVVDTVTGEVLEESPDPQPAPEQTPADPPAPTGELPFTGHRSAAAEETSVEQIGEWIRSLAKLKFGDDKAAYHEFLDGRNPNTMERDSLIKLHGDLAAL